MKGGVGKSCQKWDLLSNQLCQRWFLPFALAGAELRGAMTALTGERQDGICLGAEAG